MNTSDQNVFTLDTAFREDGILKKLQITIRMTIIHMNWFMFREPMFLGLDFMKHLTSGY